MVVKSKAYLREIPVNFREIQVGEPIFAVGEILKKMPK